MSGAIVAARLYHPRDADEYSDLGETLSYIINSVSWDTLYPYFDEYRAAAMDQCADGNDDTNDYEKCVEEMERRLSIEAAKALEDELGKIFVVRRVEDRVYIFAPDGTVRVVIIDLNGGIDGGSIFMYAVVNASIPLPATPSTLRFLDEMVLPKTVYDYGVETIIEIGDDVRVYRREIRA